MDGWIRNLFNDPVSVAEVIYRRMRRADGKLVVVIVVVQHLKGGYNDLSSWYCTYYTRKNPRIANDAVEIRMQV